MAKVVRRAPLAGAVRPGEGLDHAPEVLSLLKGNGAHPVARQPPHLGDQEAAGGRRAAAPRTAGLEEPSPTSARPQRPPSDSERGNPGSPHGGSAGVGSAQKPGPCSWDLAASGVDCPLASRPARSKPRGGAPVGQSPLRALSSRGRSCPRGRAPRPQVATPRILHWTVLSLSCGIDGSVSLDTKPLYGRRVVTIPI